MVNETQESVDDDELMIISTVRRDLPNVGEKIMLWSPQINGVKHY